MKFYSKEILDNIEKVSNYRNLPQNHFEYLIKLRKDYNFIPKTIYDVGACVLHWTQRAQAIWPESEIVLFDATDSFEDLYIKSGLSYHINVISDKSNKVVKFYQNNDNFAGNSYYRENPKHSPAAEYLFDESSIVELTTIALDDLVANKFLNLPELIKIDVQGAELDILKGANKTLTTCEHLIIELRNIEYNIGSPDKEEIIDYLQTKGFKNLGLFCDNGPDGDYHFIKE